MASLKEKSLSLLVSAASVDYNNGAKQTIYTIPTGKSCIIHSIVVRNASADVHVNSVSYGFNAACTDVIANAAYAGLTGATIYIPIMAKASSVVGTSGQIFGVFCNTTDTAGTVTIDVFGYLF
jgi:hypothetical protein